MLADEAVGPMPARGVYCAYRDYAGLLDTAGCDWLVGMFHVYFDDSGTHKESEIAVAACYISTKRGWDEFVEAWDSARWEEGFDVFHMAEFVAPREQGHKPFCDWDNTKKEHVFRRLAKIVNENKMTGIACAVPKAAYGLVPDRIRNRHGREHYTFAVRSCMGRIADWRTAGGITIPMQFVFDNERGQKRSEIEHLWGELEQHPSWEKTYGMAVGGYSFQGRAAFKPLQAADILAWQMGNHMRRIMPIGHDDESAAHPGFRLLREDQNMDLRFFTEQQIRNWIRDIEEYEVKHGPLC